MIKRLYRFFSDKHGNSSGRQAFAFLTVIGIIGTIALAAKIGGSSQPRLHPSFLIVLPLMCSGVGALMWAADASRRRKHQREQARRGLPVEVSMAVDSDRNERSGKWIAAVAGVTIVPLVLVVLGVRAARDYASITWQPTTCMVTKFDMSKPWKDYEFRITVAYQVSGQTFDVVVDAPNAMAVKSAQEAKKVEAKFAPGTQHEVFVNPADPQEASLRRGPTFGTMVMTVMLPIWGCIAVFCSIRFMVRNRPGRRRETVDVAIAHGASEWKRAA